jgi:hypothetical protein
MDPPKAEYPWQESYITAVFEPDNSLMLNRIYEALAAIEQRRLTPVPNADERCALVKAEDGLRALITERTYEAF